MGTKVMEIEGTRKVLTSTYYVFVITKSWSSTIFTDRVDGSFFRKQVFIAVGLNNILFVHFHRE